MMDRLSRRQFLRSTFVGAGTLAVTTPWAAESMGYEKNASAIDRIELGKTGIKTSRVAMGTGFNGGRHESNQTRLGQAKFTELIRTGIDHGLNFIDMADLYGSQPFVKNAMEGVPRDQYVLLSKIWFSGGSGMETTDRAVPSVERFLTELGTDHLDICLIHCLQDGDWTNHRKRMCDEMSQLKEQGKVRAVGCSCHNLDALKIAAENPWVDVIFTRINNMGKIMDDPNPDTVAAVLKKARANGKAVVGMKIYGAGNLVKPEERDASLRFVWGNHLVDAMTIGFEKSEQILDSVDHLTKVLRA